MPKATSYTRERSRDDTRASRRCVLVAVGADSGLSALKAARMMAVRESRPLVVLSVVEPPPLYSFDPETVMAVPWTIDEQLAARRKSVHDRLAQLGAPPFGLDEPEIIVQYGEPERLVGATARERRAHVIVMGTGPHTLANRILATETTLGTIRHSPCPVFAVAEDCSEAPRVVVVALDFSPASVHAARQALPLLSDGAVVHLVHVWRRHIPLMPTTQTDPLDDAYEHALPARFDRARATLGREHSLVFISTALEGDPATVLLQTAHKLHADLVVAGAQGHSFVERLLVGSVSTALLRGAPCSVLIAPEPSPAERTRLERHMTGTSTLRAPEEWAEELEAFSKRNRSRRTALEIDDVSLGSQVLESGYALLGATYDHRDRHVSLMFADPTHPEAHLTRTLGRVRSVAVSHGDRGEDGALCIESEQGSTLLTFLDQPAR